MSQALPKVVITDFINDSLSIEKDVLEGVATVEAFDAYDEMALHGKIESAKAVDLLLTSRLDCRSKPLLLVIDN